MSLRLASNRGDEYYTPDYVVDIVVPLLKNKKIKTVWCPFDKEYSEYVKVLTAEGFTVIYTHVDLGQDFLTYVPSFEFDAIVSNPPFSLKNEVFTKVISYNKPWALLMSATSVQSSSFIESIAKESHLSTIMFNKRISYNGDRPPFPSWYFTGKLHDSTLFYIYDEEPKKLYNDWVNSGGITCDSKHNKHEKISED